MSPRATAAPARVHRGVAPPLPSAAGGIFSNTTYTSFAGCMQIGAQLTVDPTITDSMFAVLSSVNYITGAAPFIMVPLFTIPLLSSIHP